MSLIEAIFSPSPQPANNPPAHNAGNTQPTPAPQPEPAPQPATEPEAVAPEDVDDGTYQPGGDVPAEGESPVVSENQTAEQEPATDPAQPDGSSGTNDPVSADPTPPDTAVDSPAEESAPTPTTGDIDAAEPTPQPVDADAATPADPAPADDNQAEPSEPSLEAGTNPVSVPSPQAELTAWSISLESARAARDARVGTLDLTPPAGASVTPISTTLTSAIFALVEHDMADITRIAEQTAQNMRLQGILSMLSANNPALPGLLDDGQDGDVATKLAARAYRQY